MHNTRAQLSSLHSGCTRANPVDETIIVSIPNFQIDAPPVDPAYSLKG